MIRLLEKIQGMRGQFHNDSELSHHFKTNQNFKNEISTLYRYFFGKPLKGCDNCMCDAFHLLVNHKKSKAMNKINCEFTLRTGALLTDVRGKKTKLMCSRHNITNALALYHLKTNPECVKFFDSLPKDWKKQVEEYIIPGTKVVVSKTIEKVKPVNNDTPEQIEAEQVVIDLIKEQLSAGKLVKDIKVEVKELRTVGTKALTSKFTDELVKRAKAV